MCSYGGSRQKYLAPLTPQMRHQQAIKLLSWRSRLGRRLVLIYRITASAHYLVHYLVYHLAHHLAVAPFLLMTQPTAAVAPAAVAPAAVVALARA